MTFGNLNNLRQFGKTKFQIETNLDLLHIDGGASL